ncbi:MAG: TIGR04255 family protein, partial [Bacteroidota bacterium]
MGTTKLSKAPLKEVIFELQWNGIVNNFGMPEDVGFDLSQGKFADLIKGEFPVHKKLVEENPSVRTFGVPIHQYWTGELQWPVVQHGKGILTVNETEGGYMWENSYKALILRTIDYLRNSYELDLEFNRVKLQYI